MYTRRVDVFSRGEELCGLAVGAHAGLLAGPGAVAPGEEDDPEFLEDVGVGDVEVVFEGGDVYVAVDLVDISGHRFAYVGSGMGGWPTFCSTYSCPAATALLPIWKPICAVGSLMKPPKAGCT